MTPTYFAVIADATASRGLDARRRDALQQQLRALVADWNRTGRYRAERAARFALTLGDELQGLLRSPLLVWELAHTLRARVPEVEWIVACGRGPLATRLSPPRSAPELDGPCFHAARAALDAAKRGRRLLAFGGFETELERRLSGFAAYYSALHWSWTPRQRRTATLLRLMPPGAAAGRLAVDRSAISHLARRMGWPQVAAGDLVFRSLLEGT